MREVRKLAGQTIIYGAGTIVPRFLNYVVLTPLFTYTFENKAHYGVITELYALMVILLVVLTYGMETGFFRFSQKSHDQARVYSTALFSLLGTTILFLILTNIFITEISAILRYSNKEAYIRMFVAIVAIDAFSSIPFARLRRDNRPLAFSIIKIANVVVSVSIVVFFLRVAPRLYEANNSFIVSFFDPDDPVRYVFLSNLIGSSFTLLLLVPVIVSIKPIFDIRLWRHMVLYSFPLLIAGMAGTINDVVDKLLIRRVTTEGDGLDIVGEYGGGYKVAVLMAIFVQMFRFAAEPFFFEKAGKSDAKATYAFVMKNFIIIAFMVFMGINLFMPVLQYFVGPVYREAIIVVPAISFAYLLYGIFVNLSVWYKVNDMTRFGAYITIAGAVVTLTLNITLLPLYGYIASAWTHVACYGVMVVLSYIVGRRHYPVGYDIRGFFIYAFFAVSCVVVLLSLDITNAVLHMIIGAVMMTGFIIFAEKRDGVITTLLKRE